MKIDIASHGGLSDRKNIFRFNLNQNRPNFGHKIGSAPEWKRVQPQILFHEQKARKTLIEISKEICRIAFL